MSVTWEPGRFSCPLVFVHTFSLHWRLKPQLAKSSVIDALHPFCVLNRSDTLVFAAVESIFYMKFLCTTLDIDSPSAVGEPLENPSDVEDLTSSQENFTHGIIQRKASSPSLSSGRDLVLEVYGVGQPGHEITEEFVALVESKLNATLLHIIGTLLSRNSTLRLSKQDLSFLLPVETSSNKSFFRLPEFVLPDPHIFLMLFRQSISKIFHSFNGNGVPGMLQQYCERRGIKEFGNANGRFGFVT